jgi:hypothetical protein
MQTCSGAWHVPLPRRQTEIKKMWQAQHRLRAAVGTVALFYMALTSAQPSSPEGSAAPPVQALWKAQEIEFTFESFTTFYSCSSLETKVARVLEAVGVDPTMKVRTRGCFERQVISRMPIVQITLRSPVEVTPENLAELEKGRSLRELTARVRGDRKLAEDAEKQFPAQWRQVSLSRGRLRLEPGDCELVEQLKKKVFPKLGVRIIDDGVSCRPNQLSSNQPRLTVEALTALPTPDAPDKSK